MCFGSWLRKVWEKVVQDSMVQFCFMAGIGHTMLIRFSGV